MTYPAKSLTKPLLVPSWDAGTIELYTPDPTNPNGPALSNPNFTVDVQTVLNNAAGAQGLTPNPNVCRLYGTSLYFTNNALFGVAAHPSQGIFGLPNYLNNPQQAVQNAFLLDGDGDAYVGLTFDSMGNLYASVQYSGATAYQIVQYPGASTATGAVGYNALGSAGSDDAFFGNLIFDGSGNLWTVDYQNNRLVVISAASLAAGNGNTWVALENPAVATELAVANTVAGLNGSTPYLFAGPEGLDFDGFGRSPSLWVSNNNDGNSGIPQENHPTSLVEITAALQQKLLAKFTANTGVSVTADSLTAGTDFNIYQMPNYTGVTPQFGGLQVDKAAGRLYVNDEATGWVRGYDLSALAATPASTTDTDSQIAPNFVTSNRGNGGLSLQQLGCYVADYTGDPGLEPDTAGGVPPNVPWESPSIVATIENTPNLTALPTPYEDPDLSLGADGTDTILGSTTQNGPITRYIYVQVNNFGPTATTGIEQLNLYWAKALASGLDSWPAPWDGSQYNTPNFPNSPLGGAIQLGIPISAIAPTLPGQATPSHVIVGPITWSNVPNPTQYDPPDGHFCLLARIVTPNSQYAANTAGDSALPDDTSIGGFAGMTVPEIAGDLGANVLNNARICWRNIHIIASEPGGGGGTAGPAIRIPPSVVFPNRGGAPLSLRIGFELLDEQRRIVPAPEGRLLIAAAGPSLAVLERSSVGKLPHADARRPRHHRGPVSRIASGIEGIALQPGETLQFEVDYQPPPGLRHYAIRAKAYVQGAGGERLVGGQTFVYGQVEGITTRPRYQRE